MNFKIKKTIDVKLNVRPVSVSLYHNYVFEGPCRFVGGDKLSKDYDLRANDEKHERFVRDLTSALSPDDVNIMEPIHIQRNETFVLSDAHFEEIAKDIDAVDFYFFTASGGGAEIMEFVQRYKKPVAVMGIAANTAMAASMINRGLEAYACEDYNDAADLMKILRVRKALRETKVLLISRLNSVISDGMTDSFRNLEEVTQRLGARFRYYNLHEFIDQTRNVPWGANPSTPGRMEPNINDQDELDISKMTKQLIRGAQECDMSEEDVFASAKVNHLVKKLLSELECNAFAAPCRDSCATRRMNEERFTYCLNHSLNNEEGIPSACEYDISALLAMVVLSNFSRSAAYMGNTIPNPFKIGMLQNNMMFKLESIRPSLEEVRSVENLVLTFHSVPNRKLRGYDKDNAPYAIRSFTHSNWGATIRYDFANDAGQVITMCNFDPSCKKLFVARGKIVGGIGYTDINCSEGVLFEVDDSRQFFKKMSLVGNHIPLVYGDYVDQITELAEVIGLEVLTA